MSRHHLWSLVWTLAWSDFNVRYVSSGLGVIWAVAKPLLMFAVLAVVLSFITLPTVTSLPSLLIGIALWSFFAEVTLFTMEYMVAKRELVRKIPFPLIALPLAAALQAIMILAINCLVVLVLLPHVGAPLSASSAGALIPLAAYIAFSVGCGLLLTVASSRWPDIRHGWEVLLQLLFFASPVIYPLNLVPAALERWYLLNPIALILDTTRRLVLQQPLKESALVLSVTVGITTLVIGLLLMVQAEPHIRDRA